MFTGILRKPPTEPEVYIHHLPVTTEIAWDAGVEFAGYPKFLADIEFEKKGDWVICSLQEGGRHALTLTGRAGETSAVPRSRSHPITDREGFILRCESIVSERLQTASRDASDVRLELGDHSIAKEVRALELGKLVAYEYTPQHQAILTPVLESFAA